MTRHLPPWPYPRWIAHRGAGLLAPENTLAAMRLGASHGYRMFECDAKLSQDDVPFLLHDATLERTTTGHGTAGDLPWQALAQLDAGRWHSPGYAGEALPALEDVVRYCQEQQLLLNIEIKPTPGTERHTGEVVAAAAATWLQGAAVPPLLTSFQPEALQGARDAAPQLPRGLLLHQLWPDWDRIALELGCVAVVCHYPLWDATSHAKARDAGLRTLSYTVNQPEVAQRLLALGVDSLITDRIDLFAPGA